jgi:23S rRNA pseudouridine2605 synthase
MRLQKYLAHAGICSRRKAEEHISNGRVKVNDSVVKTPGTKVDLENDRVLFDDKKVGLKIEAPRVYIVLNKPEGYVTSCSQEKTKIILDLIDIDTRIYPVGRLDKDSKGLVLLTNDGDLHNRLSHPSFNHEKEYIVTTVRPISDSDLKTMESGVVIDKNSCWDKDRIKDTDKDRVKIKTRKAGIKRLSKNKFTIVLKQGLNRQIRKMVEQTGNKVDILQRTRMSNINLGNLTEGSWRYLNDKEVRQLTST